MEQDKKYFGNGAGSFDMAEIAVRENDWVNMRNMRVGSTDRVGGGIGMVESYGSTINIFSDLPDGINICLGGAYDAVGNRIVWANWNSMGNFRIYCYSLEDNQVYTVLSNPDVSGIGLNFNKYYLIHSCYVINGFFYWTDNYNEPRRVNIDAGIKLYHPAYDTDQVPYTSPIEQAVISWVRRQPSLPVTVTKDIDVDFVNNFIENEAFQFCYRYIYRSYEPSTLSGYSDLVNYSTPEQIEDDVNRINITFPFEEQFAQDVLRVDLVVRFLNTQKYFIIRTWDKNDPEDAAAMAAHNAGTALTYEFYNDKIGIPLDLAYATKPFDPVPLLAKTVSFARNRAFMGHIKAGYDTPEATEDYPATSLTLSLQEESSTGAPGTAQGRWLKITYGFGSFTKYFLDVVGLSEDNGYYEPNSPLVPPFPGTINYTDITFRAADFVSFSAYINANFPGWSGPIVYEGGISFINGGPPVATLVDATAFKTDAYYQAAIDFKDIAGRKCGAITNDSLIINIPEREYTNDEYVTGINWTLDQSRALFEIPVWAHSYDILITKCLRTRFFIQCKAKNAAYATKDADGAYVFTESSYTATRNGCAFDITLLDSQKMGYVWEDGSGDIMKVWIDGDPTVYKLEIIGQSGNWIITELANMDTLDNSKDILFEIYTPYRPDAAEPFWEVAETYLVSNPGSDSRQYSVLGGVIDGDIILMNRDDGTDDYLTENMSPNDKFYRNWNTDAGRSNFITETGQEIKPNTIVWSNTFVQGTQINGLSSFEALNSDDLPLECAPLSKLQVTTKVQNEQGIVMLALCERETVSIYIGEVQMQGSTGTSVIVQAPEVIGTKNVLRGNFGTINPESVVTFQGLVFYVDAINGKVIQYSTNGLFPVSNYDCTRFWKLYLDQFNSMTPEQIEAMSPTNRPFIFGGIDPHHGELLVSVPKLLDNSPEGVLPLYSGVQYPWQIYDGQSKAMVYRISDERKYWIGSFDVPAESFITAENKLFAFKEGALYLCNSTTNFGTYFGVQQPCQIMPLHNVLPNKPKVPKNVAIECNLKPDLAIFYCEYPWQQLTDITDDEYVDKEGQFYAYIKRNRLTPVPAGQTINGLLQGEQLRSIVTKILLSWNVSNTPVQLRFINIGYSISKGHTT